MSNIRPQHFMALDSFRGLCACAVALAHFQANSVLNLCPLFDRGDIYVDFFFVLSGFVIYANYGAKLQNGAVRLRDFMWLRFWRLYPLHLITLLAFVGFDLLQLLLPTVQGALYAPFSARGEDLSAIIANLLLVHSLNTVGLLSFNGPSWSISTEFYTYLVFAAVLVYAPKRANIIILLTAISSALAVYLLRGDLFAKFDYGLLRCFYGFACGIGAYHAWQWLTLKSLTPMTKHAGAFEAVTLLLTGAYISWWSYGGGSMVAPLVFAVLVVVFAFEGGKIARLLQAKPLIWLGTLSYAIYMLHMFIAGKLFDLPIRLASSHFGLDLITQDGTQKLIGTNMFSGSLFELFYLAVVIFAAMLSYRWLEKPCRDWGRRHKPA